MGLMQEEEDMVGRTTPDFSKRPEEQPPVKAKKTEKKMKTPRRKVYAGGAGGGTAGLLSVILAYHFPSMPATVTAAYASLLVILLGFVAAYFTHPEDN